MQIIQAISHALWNGVHWVIHNVYLKRRPTIQYGVCTTDYTPHIGAPYPHPTHSGMLSVSGHGGRGTLKQARTTNQITGLPYNSPR